MSILEHLEGKEDASCLGTKEFREAALFYKAVLVSKFYPERYEQANQIFDSLIYESWNGNISFKNLLPCILAKYYYKFKYSMLE
jgi:hypothetical protein